MVVAARCISPPGGRALARRPSVVHQSVIGRSLRRVSARDRAQLGGGERRRHAAAARVRRRRHRQRRRRWRRCLGAFWSAEAAAAAAALAMPSTPPAAVRRPPPVTHPLSGADPERSRSGAGGSRSRVKLPGREPPVPGLTGLATDSPRPHRCGAVSGPAAPTAAPPAAGRRRRRRQRGAAPTATTAAPGLRRRLLRRLFGARRPGEAARQRDGDPLGRRDRPQHARRRRGGGALALPGEVGTTIEIDSTRAAAVAVLRAGTSGRVRRHHRRAPSCCRRALCGPAGARARDDSVGVNGRPISPAATGSSSTGHLSRDVQMARSRAEPAAPAEGGGAAEDAGAAARSLASRRAGASCRGGGGDDAWGRGRDGGR